MGLKYIRDTYGVPATRGARVRYQGRFVGVITSASGPHIKIRRDGDKHSLPYHPTWKIEYL